MLSPGSPTPKITLSQNIFLRKIFTLKSGQEVNTGLIGCNDNYQQSGFVSKHSLIPEGLACCSSMANLYT